uniref:Uncharacterized protein n=1 Tax=Periophthalmus magnuspinnatus TaxID=409849 RepID=A0A3B3ZWB0_9GOBI
MEALSSSLTTGEQSGGQEHSEQDSPHVQTPSPSKPQQSDCSKSSHGAPQQSKQSKRQLPERKRLRAQRQSIDSDTIPEHKQKETKTLSENSPATTPGANSSKAETQEGTPKQKRERKPQKPGKYVCTYCGRACAKPSVLQKHIRSHTGERPYPCPPCGFSFKTKSNLYKHRKSHTHRVKAGLTVGDSRPSEEQITESEDEARHLPSASTIPSIKNLETNQVKDTTTTAMDNSYAVRKRLAMRLSRGRVETPKDTTDDKNLSLILGSKESTESGYFSRSESTEQDIYPNTSAKSYAEIILGKYGRLGHLQRMSRQNNQQSPSQEDKGVPFTVPKKQVIDHITKLITINEAVVDTSKIDSVKPRRFSLSRKNSDPQKSSPPKEPLLQVPKPKFQHHSPNVHQPGQTSAPLLRSHSMPTGATSTDVAPVAANKFRLSQSFDEREPSQSQVPRRYGMLRRQPAIDGDSEGPHSFFSDSLTTVPDHSQSQPQPYECETCGTGCKDWEGYKKHRQTLCLVHRPRNEVVISQMECSQIMTQSARPGALALRKRRKAESFELEDPASPTALSSCPESEQCNFTSNAGYEIPKRPTQTCSVIQHTSSFEKQESLSDSQSTEPTKDPPIQRDSDILQKQSELSGKVLSRKLVRQHSVQVPEILVTEDSHTNPENVPSAPAKPSERSEEFQWPQRSSSLAQLPIEKLPPKKKRLRLAEAAQSSGESSFESISLPHSPSQESSASYASSRSTSFEESNRLESETLTSPRRSRAPQMLTVPGVHPHREMRRSASEQAPHDLQPQNVTMSETRSKSFDYSSLSPERSALGWRERRKCLLIRHTAVTDPDEEDLPSSSVHTSEKVSFSPQTTSVYCSKSPGSPLQGETISQYSKSIEIVHQWKQQNVQLTQNSEQLNKVVGCDNPFKEEALKVCTDPLSSLTPNPTQGLSGAARLEIPPGPRQSLVVSHSHMPHSSVPQIISSVERVRPITSAAVVVRFQTHTLTPACAIYTTLSQAASPKPLEAVDAAVPHSIDQSAVDCLNYGRASPELPDWSGELRTSGSGGNKRVLSPSNSIELSPESQQQQKRVKEDEVHDTQELNPEPPSCRTSECPPVSQAGPPYPTLLSSTCNSWCYLNYVKPNPAALDEEKPSVYSSWSTSGYDPNPPGLSSKTALSLVHCKQRLSPTIYTTSSMSAPSDEAKEEHRPSDSSITTCEISDISFFQFQSPIPLTAQNRSIITQTSNAPTQTNPYNPRLKSPRTVTPVTMKKKDPLLSLPSPPPPPSPTETAPKGPRQASEGLCSPGDDSSPPPSAQAPPNLQKKSRLRPPRPAPPCLCRPAPLRVVMSAAPQRAVVNLYTSLTTLVNICHTFLSYDRYWDSIEVTGCVSFTKLFYTEHCKIKISTCAYYHKMQMSSLTYDLFNHIEFVFFQPPSERDIPHAAPHPNRGRLTRNLLSHLPLHSQHTARSPSLLIPIGGIHMIHPRPSTFRPPISTATSPTSTTGTLCKLTDATLLAQHPPPATPSSPQEAKLRLLLIPKRRRTLKGQCKT